MSLKTVDLYYLLCLKLRTTTYAELPWSLGLSLFPYFWHLQQLGCHSFLIFDIDSSWLTGFCFKKKEKERKFHSLGQKNRQKNPVWAATQQPQAALLLCACWSPYMQHPTFGLRVWWRTWISWPSLDSQNQSGGNKVLWFKPYLRHKKSWKLVVSFQHTIAYFFFKITK